MKLLKEIKYFYRFFWKTPIEDKQLVFYAEHEGYYPYFEGIISELIDKYQQTICYITSDLNDPIFQDSNPSINKYYLNYLMIIVMLFIKCKIFVMTLTDLNQLYYKRSINSVHYVYVFHSMMSTHMNYRCGAFDYYDSILCVGPYQLKEIRKHEENNKLNNKILIKAGYYRLERIYAKYQLHLANQSDVNRKTTVLIAPSWGERNILESCGGPLIELLLKNKYKVIVRPHPETVLNSSFLIDKFKTKYNTNPDFALELSTVTDDSLLNSDILISDLSGIAFEYAFGTERPVIFLDVPHKCNNKDFARLGIKPIELAMRSKLGVVVSPENLKTIPSVIEKIISKQTDYRNEITKLREENVFAFGYSSEIGAMHIVDHLNAI